MTEYIVELQPKTWLASWQGDPGRTLDINSARRFEKKSSAYRSLANALDKRDFSGPKVIPINVCPACNGVCDAESKKCTFCGE
ncbi:hypothetical protein KA005_05030 [bacterium]|nr:hypothetical protein [bacterium]